MPNDPVSEAVRDVSFADKGFLADPWSDLLRLQKEDPVHWSDNQRGWIITRHADVRAAFADKRLSSARGNQLFGNLPQELQRRLDTTIKFNALNVNRLDGRDHLRIRMLLMKAFSGSIVRSLAPAIGAIVDELLDIAEDKVDFDFQAEIASVLPTRVIQMMLGIPETNRQLLFKLASDFTSATGAATITPELLLALDASIRSLNEIFNQLIIERETAPGDDLISTLVHARDGQNKLDHEELLACFHAIIVAGVETTAHSLGTGLVELIRNPELAARAAQGAEQCFPLVTEMLRYPGTAKCMTRLAAEDFEWEHRSIKQGDLVWLMIAGANVDPTVFDAARTIDPDRDNAAAMSFAPGLHHCIGHLLTRLELSQFFSRAFARFDITLTSQDLDFVPSYIFRGYRELAVRFKAKAHFQ